MISRAILNRTHSWEELWLRRLLRPQQQNLLQFTSGFSSMHWNAYLTKHQHPRTLNWFYIHSNIKLRFAIDTQKCRKARDMMVR